MCIARLRAGHLSAEDKECYGKPTQVTIPDNNDTLHSMILDDQRISDKIEILAISQESVGYIVHEILDKRKLPAKRLPIYLNADQKCD
jgi:hypothetical protein